MTKHVVSLFVAVALIVRFARASPLSTRVPSAAPTSTTAESLVTAADGPTEGPVQEWKRGLERRGDRVTIVQKVHQLHHATVEIELEVRSGPGCRLDLHELFFIPSDNGPRILEDAVRKSSCCPGVGKCWTPKPEMNALGEALSARRTGPLSDFVGSRGVRLEHFGTQDRTLAVDDFAAAVLGTDFSIVAASIECTPSTDPMISCTAKTARSTRSGDTERFTFVWNDDGRKPQLQSIGRDFGLRPGEY